jgi:hypothetical protein
MKRLALLTLAALVAACSDGGTRPEPVATVNILRGSSGILEHRMRVGETVQLSAALYDEAGNRLSNRDVTWTSSRPDVATVSEAGLVTALSIGESIVTATSEGVSDEVAIIVEADPNAALVCEEGDAGRSLAVGEVYTTSAAGSPIWCVAGGSAGSEYVVVPFHAAEAPQNLQVTVAANGVVAASGPPNPSLAPAPSGGAGLSVPRLQDDTWFHYRFRERQREELAPLVRGGGLTAQYSRSTVPSDVAADVPSVGDLVRYNVNSRDGQACTNGEFHWARVMAISQTAVVVADTLNPSGGFTQAEYEQFAVTFDTLVHPAVTGNFGAPADIDENGGRSVILFTRAVNERTPMGVNYVILGFFHSRDLFPKVAGGGLGGCATSNEAEMFYVLVPDPNGEIDGRERTKEFVMNSTVSTIAHEFQHLISASRRLYIVRTSSWFEELWLNEGLSHIAEELTYYAATPHEPEQNLDIDDITANEAILNHWGQYASQNFSRFMSYLRTPRTQSPMSSDEQDDDLETRGATWAFLRYTADRHGGDESAFWKALVDNDTTGLANLNEVLGSNALTWMNDWAVSVYTDDAVSTLPTYQIPSWNFRSIYPNLQGTSGTYPLSVRPLPSGLSNAASMTLQGGGTDYLRFGIAAGQRAALRATSGGVAAPGQLMISIVRTK